MACVPIIHINILPQLFDAIELRHKHPAEVNVYVKDPIVLHRIRKLHKRRTTVNGVLDDNYARFWKIQRTLSVRLTCGDDWLKGDVTFQGSHVGAG